MPPAAQPTAPVALLCGDEDFAVKQRARQLYEKWCGEVGGMDHETIDAAVGNANEALKALGKLRADMGVVPAAPASAPTSVLVDANQDQQPAPPPPALP